MQIQGGVLNQATNHSTLIVEECVLHFQDAKQNCLRCEKLAFKLNPEFLGTN